MVNAVNASSFLLGILVGIIGMAVETYIWMKSWKHDREIFDNRLRRRDAIIRSLIEANEKLREKVKQNERNGF